MSGYKLRIFYSVLDNLSKEKPNTTIKFVRKTSKKDVIECLFNANSFFQYVKCRCIRKKIRTLLQSVRIIYDC